MKTTVLATSLFTLLAIGLCGIAYANEAEGVDESVQLPYGKIDESLLEVSYAGTEKFAYSVAWVGGMELGRIEMGISTIPGKEDAYSLDALVTTEGSFMNKIYPIYDTYTTWVSGKQRLPYYYEVHQKEGRGYEAVRKTRYYQELGAVHFRKNDNPIEKYRVNGKIHNEFSAFFSSRVMNLEVGNSFRISTFADKKENDVAVIPLAVETAKDTLFGDVEVVKVTPILKFKGLYDKSGDTTIWYTNDECRVPVLIKTKIVLGSAVAKLRSYENPLCPKYSVEKSQGKAE